jgi:hypothetical protein
LLLLLLLISDLPGFCQIEGESEATTIIIKKSGTHKNDVEPPRIKMISPRVDTSFTATVSESHLFLIGRLTDESEIQSFRINETPVETDENGFFQQTLDLTEGINVFKLDATDVLSNSSTRLLSLVLKTVEKSITGADEMIYEGTNYALIIGIDNYSDPALIDLDNPVTDATLLYSTLIGNYMFDPENVILLKNSNRADIIKKLDELSYKLTKNDNLLIFYAGHGFWDSEKETGFWLPADADKFSSVNWIRNSTIQDFVDDISTKHTLLITDACFAGSIFKSRGGFEDATMAVKKLYSMTSRKAMTSGTLEQVPDRSVFLEYLLKRLLENDKKYLSAGELFNSFREAVLNNSPNVPQYGVIQDTGDEGGEFIFIRK